MNDEQLLEFCKNLQEEIKGKDIWESTDSVKATEPNNHYYTEAEYASNVIQTIPYGWIDKTSCGCGFTSVALRSNKGTIVAVPAVALIKDKITSEQNDSLLGVYDDATTEQVEKHVETYHNGKIMVTYDSLHKCRSAIEAGWDIVVDESDKVFTLKSLKSKSKKNILDDDAMTRMMKILYLNRERVSFISATPVDRNLYMPDWVKELPYHKFVFKHKPIKVERVFNSNPIEWLKFHVIKSILNNGEAVDHNGNKKKKAVIFLNSVRCISDIVEEFKLDKSNTAYIAANTNENEIKLSSIPRLEADHTELPLLTFITSSGFQGIDLHDEEAASFIVADGRQRSLHIDYKVDIKQAASRIRTKSNPFYNEIMLIVNNNIKLESIEKEYNEFKKKYDTAKKVYENILKHCNEVTDSFLDFLNEFETKDESIGSFYYKVGDKIKFDNHSDTEEYYNLANRKAILIRGSKAFESDDSIFMNDVSNNAYPEIEEDKVNRMTRYEDYVNYFREHKVDKKTKVNWGEYSHQKGWIDLIESCWKMTGKTYLTINGAQLAIVKVNSPNHEKFKKALVKLVKYNVEYTSSDLRGFVEKASKVVVGWKPSGAPKTIIREYFEIKEKTKGNGDRVTTILKQRK